MYHVALYSVNVYRRACSCCYKVGPVFEINLPLSCEVKEDLGRHMHCAPIDNASFLAYFDGPCQPVPIESEVKTDSECIFVTGLYTVHNVNNKNDI